jgi:hypothetical protein
MAAIDLREYDTGGDVINNYLTPDEAREQGLAWQGRPNEPTPYRTEDESAMRSRPYDYRAGLDDSVRPWTPEAEHYAKVGNYDYGALSRLISSGRITPAKPPSGGGGTGGSGAAGGGGDGLDVDSLMPAPGTPGSAGAAGVAFHTPPDQSVLDNLDRLGIPYQVLGGGTTPPTPPTTPTTPTPTTPRSPAAQFTDPITGPIEGYARQRAEERERPSSGSGQALLEQALKDIAAQFRQGGFTPGEQEVFQTQALDPLEQLRTARKRQVLQQLSARGIDPNSGVGMSMLADVDRQFDALRAQTQRSIAAQGAQETASRMQTAIQLLGSLAGTENQRLNEGFQYRTVPMNLADRSFSQGLQMYNAGGNPLTLAQPLMQLSQQQSNRSDNLQETLGYLAAILAAQG